MASKDMSKKSGYVVDVKVVDVEKRYHEGPKHYVGSKKCIHNKENADEHLGLHTESCLGQSNEYIYYLSTIQSIL